MYCGEGRTLIPPETRLVCVFAGHRREHARTVVSRRRGAFAV
jgi:hypothetical protein